ncbi:hypothetical protein E4U36_000437 [Claviceps purpurea]|nr:hypothetical protein E4U36_000437 [Claviceps purpurea]
MLLNTVAMRFGYSQPRSLAKFVTTWLVLLLTTYMLWHTWFAHAHRTKTQSNVYAFYAHNDIYACSLLVNAHILRHVFHTRYRIVAILSDGVSTAMRDRLVERNITIMDDTPLPLHEGTIPYYDGCLLKLSAFKLHEYDPTIQRALVLDADQLILQNLDDLFDIRPAVQFMAPTAYWLSNRTISSTCMLIQPGAQVWDRVKTAAANMTSSEYDMDLMNRLFGDPEETPVRLNSKFVTLNSHWEDWNLPAWFNNATEHQGPTWFEDAERQAAKDRATSLEMHALHNQAAIVHFTAVGKPWSLATEDLRKRKPDAHPLLAQQWRTWRSLAMQECPAGTMSGVV